ncbi:MAG: UPF0280 family protein [Candidatus Omnitrophota bacterium]
MEIYYKESDILLCTDKPIDKQYVKDLMVKHYDLIAAYIDKRPQFQSSLSPIDTDGTAPLIVQDMLKCSRYTGIGPFASVAGAISHYVGMEIIKHVNEVIIENGGDLFLKITEDKEIGVYLGSNFKPDEITIKVKKRSGPFGIASSSSTIGHSLNFGKTDLVTVIAKDSIAADGFATALSNRIKREEDAGVVLKDAQDSPLIDGIIIAFNKKIYLWGDLEVI